jgi:hypothetical protein
MHTLILFKHIHTIIVCKRIKKYIKSLIYGVVMNYHISNLHKLYNFREIGIWITLFERTSENIWCSLIALSTVGLLERTQLTNTKWQVLPSKIQCLCYGVGRQNQLLKCKDITVGNMENKHLEYRPSNNGWYSLKRQVVSA